MEPTPRPEMPSEEPFFVHDKATNQRHNIREATDEMLVRFAQITQSDLRGLMVQVQQAILQLSLCAQQGAVIAYELHRRRKAAGGITQ